MTDYLRHLAAKNLNLEKGVAPRLPAFFEPAAYEGALFNGRTYLDLESVPGEREGLRTESRTSAQDGSNTAPYQSPISGQSEVARTKGSMPLIPAKPGIGFPGMGSSLEAYGARSFRYVLNNRGKRGNRGNGDNRVLRLIRPMRTDLPSSGVTGRNTGKITGRTSRLIPAQREYLAQFEPELEGRKIVLDYEQAPFAAQVHRADTEEKKREPRRRVRWGPTFARQQLPNSLPSQIPAELKGQDTKEDPGYVNGRKKIHLDLANVDLSGAQDSSKGVVLVPLLPSSNSRPKIADFKMSGKTSYHLPEALFGVAKGGKNKSGSVFEGRFRGSHFREKTTFERRLERSNFKIGDANETDQKISRSIKMTSSAAALIHPGIAGGQSAASTSEQPLPDNSLPSSNLRPEIADSKMVREKTTLLQQALFGMAKKENNRSGSVFERRPEGNHSRLKKANDIDQEISRSIEITGTAATFMQPNTGIKQSAAGTSEQPFLDHSLPSSNLSPEIADFKMVREKTTPLQQALFGMAKGDNNRSGSVFERRPEGNHSRLKKANDIDQKISRSIEITGTAATFMQPNAGIKQSAASMSKQPFLDRSLLFSELRPQTTDLVNDRKNGSFLVKAISIDSIPAKRSRAGHLELRNAADSHQEAERSPEKAVHSPLAANGKSTIQVTIGRIEVRAERPNRAPSAPPVCRTASVSRLSLDEYLKQRSAGQI